MASDLLKTADLISEYKLLAGRANKRLERLEKAGKTGKAYKSAARAVSTISPGKTKVRFPSGTKGLSDRQIKLRINKMNEFLNQPSSTVSGEKAIYKGVSRTLSERYGLNLSPDQLGQVFDGALWEKLNTRFGSATAVKILASIQKTGGNAKETLKDLAEKHQYLSKSEKLSLSATINNYMRSNGINYVFGEE